MSKHKNILNSIESIGNKLPHPVTIFLMFTLIVVVLSHILYVLDVRVSFTGVNNETGNREEMEVSAVSLLTSDGIAYIFTSVTENFTSFVALGPVLVAMLGVGVAEKSGYISALMTNTVTKAPKKFVTPIVVFMGIMSNVGHQSAMWCSYRSVPSFSLGSDDIRLRALLRHLQVSQAATPPTC